MRTIVTQKFAVVEVDTGQEYSEQINGYLQNEKYQNVQVLHQNRHNFCAYVNYEEVEKIAETARDEYHLAGIKFQCKDCPYCKRVEDKRVKHLECEAIKDSGEVYVRLSDEACDFFYEELKAGALLKGVLENDS